MTNEVIIRCQKTPEVGIPAYAYIYPQYNTLEPIKNLGAWARFFLGWAVPPGSSLKPPLATSLFNVHRSLVFYLWSLSMDLNLN